MHGIGGATLSEAKANLTVKEIRFWSAYIAKRGSLNFGRRIEQEIAQIHLSLLALKGAKGIQYSDLTMHEDKPEPESLEEYLEKHFSE